MMRLKIGILGTRGIPGRYGGFETFAEELSTLLVNRGHDVVVFGRCSIREAFSKNSANVVKQLEGVTIRDSPTIFHKYLETPIASFTSMLMLRKSECDCAILCNAANSPFAWLLRLKGVPVLINVDGIERRRSKWNFLGRLWYRFGEVTSCIFANKVIADAEIIESYYKRTYGISPEVVSYGACKQADHAPRQEETSSVLKQFNLEEDRFLLYVSRLEPENNALGVIEAYNKVKTNLPLAIVGDAPYSDKYKQQLTEIASSSVIFLGYQFGSAYHELRKNCTLYVQATEVGGTHPALIEAMAYGNAIVANGTPENLEVLGGAGMFYRRNDFEDLSDQLEKMLADEQLRTEYGALARKRAENFYNWEAVAEKYEIICKSVIRK
jgi:glycosyltransferase involved in cell wall biosynthesis